MLARRLAGVERGHQAVSSVRTLGAFAPVIAIATQVAPAIQGALSSSTGEAGSSVCDVDRQAHEDLMVSKVCDAIALATGSLFLGLGAMLAAEKILSMGSAQGSVKGSDGADRSRDAVAFTERLMKATPANMQDRLRSALLDAMTQTEFSTQLADLAGHPDVHVARQAALAIVQNGSIALPLRSALSHSASITEIKRNVEAAVGLLFDERESYSTEDSLRLNERLMDLHHHPDGINVVAAAR